jgi:hypothetical protein
MGLTIDLVTVFTPLSAAALFKLLVFWTRKCLFGSRMIPFDNWGDSLALK